ncbi:Hint domain-containing protein [Paracoccus rhizosphaerae]|uniref:Hint domain-containing protein n=1 Tax=Paracoccus rhizosphaerae TaxID=1133347 RepID=A0ABV6CI90_9RHOB|nr:Hint domain-containing protein [Paracoccus rhizosphaerae]
MPYLTLLDSSLISVGTGGVVSINATDLVNIYGPGQEFDQYDVGDPDAAGASTLENGETFQTVDVDGSGNVTVNPTQYTYLGTSTITNVGTINVGVPGVLDVTAVINPINGSVVTAGGNYYFVSDEPLDDDHISATLSVNVLGSPVSATAPISSVADELVAEVQAVPVAGPAVAATLNGILPTVQSNLNTVAISGTLNEDGTDVIPPDELFCFVTGTLIRTSRGLVAVEDLRVGDLVETRDNGLQPVRWTGSKKLTAAALLLKPALRPVRIRAGALGENIPSADLHVSPQHRILVRSRIAQRMFSTHEVLVAAKKLVMLDGIDIAEDMAEVEYHHFLFDRHEVVTSNGAETESLFTGPEALRSVGKDAQEEIFTLFPQLGDPDFTADPVRALASGRMGRRLAMRHLWNDKRLVG